MHNATATLSASFWDRLFQKLDNISPGSAEMDSGSAVLTVLQVQQFVGLCNSN